jgi:hypothetical protein
MNSMVNLHLIFMQQKWIKGERLRRGGGSQGSNWPVHEWHDERFQIDKLRLLLLEHFKFQIGPVHKMEIMKSYSTL